LARFKLCTGQTNTEAVPAMRERRSNVGRSRQSCDRRERDPRIHRALERVVGGGWPIGRDLSAIKEIPCIAGDRLRETAKRFGQVRLECWRLLWFPLDDLKQRRDPRLDVRREHIEGELLALLHL